MLLVIMIISWQSCWHTPCSLSFLIRKEKAGLPTGVRTSYFSAGNPNKPVNLDFLISLAFDFVPVPAASSHRS